MLQLQHSEEFAKNWWLAVTNHSYSSGKKKKPKPKLFGSDIFGWGGGLPREWVGAKKFGMSLETRQIKLFLAGYPRILPGYPGGARKVWENKVCVQFSSPNIRAQYDWTTGVLDNGTEWRKFRAVPRRYPLRSLVCTLFSKGGSRGAFGLRGAGGDHFHCAILFKIITRIKLLLSNYLGRYSYSFRARKEFISVTVTVLWVWRDYFSTVTVRYSYIKNGPWNYFLKITVTAT